MPPVPHAGLDLFNHLLGHCSHGNCSSMAERIGWHGRAYEWTMGVIYVKEALFPISSQTKFPYTVIGMLQAASRCGLVGSGRLLQSSGSAWPQVANHWVQVVWLQQNCKVRSGWPLARYQAIHKFVTHSDGHHTW